MVSAFLICSDPCLRGDDKEEDKSMLYSFPASTGMEAAQALNVFKGLSVAVRGVLDSICGEKARLVRLAHAAGTVFLACAHMQLFMLVVVLPYELPESLASHIVVLLAETLVLLLGPASSWTSGGSEGDAAPLQLLPEVAGVLDKVLDLANNSLSYTISRHAMMPWTCFEGATLHLGLPPSLQQQLQALLAPLPLPHDPSEEQAAQAVGSVDDGPAASRPGRCPFNFFRRHTVLMYRGLVLSSDLSADHTRQIWQACWCLSVFQPSWHSSSAQQAQVLTHAIALDPEASSQTNAAQAAANPSTPRQHDPHGPSTPGSRFSRAQTSSMQPQGASVSAGMSSSATGLGVTEGKESAPGSSGSSLLVLATSARYTLARVLTSYDEEMEEEMAGRLEGHAAVDLLQDIQSQVTQHLDALIAASSAYSTAASGLELDGSAAMQAAAAAAAAAVGASAGWGQSHAWPGTGGQPNAAGARIGKEGAGGKGASLFVRLMTRGRRDGPGSPGSTILSLPNTGLGAHPSMSSHSPAPSPVGMRAALHRGKATDDSILQPSSSTGMGAATQVAASSGQLLTSAVFEAGTLVTLPITPRGQSAVTSAFHLTGMQAVSPSAATITLASSPAQDAHGQRGAVPSAGGPPCRALFGPAMRLPDGAVCAVGYAPSQGTVRMAGDIPAWWADGVAEMWHGIQLARARFASHSVAVAPPPKHSRLALTLEQIEALSRARAQREGGQRLGRADPTPWQYHPELASTAPVTQITLRLACKAEAGTHDNSSSKAAGAGSAPSRVVSPVAAAAAGGGVVSGTVGGQGSRQQDLPLYLTAALLADARELFVVHGASADEDALLHALAEVTSNGALWGDLCY